MVFRIRAGVSDFRRADRHRLAPAYHWPVPSVRTLKGSARCARDDDRLPSVTVYCERGASVLESGRPRDFSEACERPSGCPRPCGRRSHSDGQRRPTVGRFLDAPLPETCFGSANKVFYALLKPVYDILLDTFFSLCNNGVRLDGYPPSNLTKPAKPHCAGFSPFSPVVTRANRLITLPAAVCAGFRTRVATKETRRHH